MCLLRASQLCLCLRRKLCSTTRMYPSGVHGLSYERDRPRLVDVQLRGVSQLLRNLSQPRRHVLGIKHVHGSRRRGGAAY